MGFLGRRLTISSSSHTIGRHSLVVVGGSEAGSASTSAVISMAGASEAGAQALRHLQAGLHLGAGEHQGQGNHPNGTSWLDDHQPGHSQGHSQGQQQQQQQLAAAAMLLNAAALIVRSGGGADAPPRPPPLGGSGSGLHRHLLPRGSLGTLYEPGTPMTPMSPMSPSGLLNNLDLPSLEELGAMRLRSPSLGIGPSDLCVTSLSVTLDSAVVEAGGTLSGTVAFNQVAPPHLFPSPHAPSSNSLARGPIVGVKLVIMGREVVSWQEVRSARARGWPQAARRISS